MIKLVFKCVKYATNKEYFLKLLYTSLIYGLACTVASESYHNQQLPSYDLSITN